MMQKNISPVEANAFLQKLKLRFEQNPERHPALEWAIIEEKLRQHPEVIWSLLRMDETGGEPDVLSFDAATQTCYFTDFSKESPAGRRSCCYDEAALHERKEHKPKFSAVAWANEIGTELLTETQYRQLQQLGTFDTKTSSWLKTPEGVRAAGGAIFGDRRYNRVFIYHNGAASYYGARGFRVVLKV